MSLEQITRVCEMLSRAGDAVPRAYRGNANAVFAAVMFGAGLGLQPMAALQGIAVVEGQPTLTATLLGALVVQAGHELHTEYDDTQATAAITRGDSGKTTTVTWTLERAKNAGLCQLREGRPWARSKSGKPLPWELYPAAMLRSRAVSECARAAAPDVLFGYGVQYTSEELGIVVDQDGLPLGGELQRYELAYDQPAPEPGPSCDWLALAAEANTVDELDAVWRGARHDQAPHHYLQRLEEAGKRRKAELARQTSTDTGPDTSSDQNSDESQTAEITA